MLLLYRLFLHLYPPGFRLEFASEMESVFLQAASDAARQGWCAVLSYFLQELIDLPRTLLWVHWHELRHKFGKTLMASTLELPQPSSHLPNREPVAWREAALAGTPALFLPLAYILPGLIILLAPASWQPAFNWISIVLIFGLLLAGVIWVWKLGWPRWSGGWVAWSWMVLLAPPGLLLQNLNRFFGFALSEFYLGVVFFTTMALLLYRLMRKDALKGILAALVLMNLLWLPHLEFIPEVRKWVVLLITWLIIALVSVLMMKLGQVPYAVGLALMATFLVAFPFTYAANYLRVYSAGTPADVIAHQANFADLTNHFAPTLAGCFAFLLGPLLACELWRLSQRSGKPGRLGFCLAFSGLLLDLIGNLTAMWLFSGDWFRGNPQGFISTIYALSRYAPVFVAALTYLGLALYIFGAFQVVRLSRQNQAAPSILVSILLVLIPAFLPILAMFPSWFGLVAVPQQVPFGFLHLERFRYLSYLVGLLVLAVAGWLAAQLNRKEIDLP